VSVLAFSIRYGAFRQQIDKLYNSWSIARCFPLTEAGPGHPCRARRAADSAGTVDKNGGGGNAVTIGGSVALIVVGAILRFGVTWKAAHVDLQVIGVILMVAGVLGLVISVVFMVMKRNERRSAQVYEERRYTEPPA
jgi:hypothetical protein